MKIILIVWLSLLCFSSYQANAEKDPFKDLPEEVISFINRMQECNGLDIKLAEEPEQRNDINSEMKKATCSRLDKDEKRLKAKYAKNKKVLNGILEGKKNLD